MWAIMSGKGREFHSEKGVRTLYTIMGPNLLEYD